MLQAIESGRSSWAGCFCPCDPEYVTKDAWGNLEVGADLPGYAFTGREWDPEIGLYYYRARYYDPKVGRFISEDPIGFEAGVNLYSYVRNSPVRLRDPFGLVDLNLTAPGSEQHDPLDKYTGSSGGFSVGAHAGFSATAPPGSRYGVSDQRARSDVLTPYELAVVIRQEMAAKGRRDVAFIELVACNMGTRTPSGDSFADELSFWLKLPVKAPGGRIFPKADGTGYVVGTPDSADGYTGPDLGMEVRGGFYGGGWLE